MNISGVIFEALESLNANKMRSALTIIGVVIGVGAVIAMLSLGEGVQASISGQISDIGSNLLFVFSGNEDEEVRNVTPLKEADVAALNDPFNAPSVQTAVASIGGRVEASYGGESSSVSMTGTTASYASVRDIELEEGEFLTDDHQLGVASVAVIGPDVADKLFGRRDGVVGETIRLAGQPLRVIGLTEAKGGSATGSEDNVVFVPLASARTRLVSRSIVGEVDTIYVQAVDADSVTAASQEVTELLRSRHRLQPGAADDFTIFSQDSIASMAESITNVLIIFLGGVAGISLLVGGIGIMNIMLVSVTERTREIGLRKALGARKSHILTQFLTESALLSLIGGLLGVLLGWGLSKVVSIIAIQSGTDITPVFTIGTVLLATLFSAAVGIFFGIYPANRAASLEPVEALRHE
ncbi:MAG: ABC transporter permease [Anaerolineaceae bacterium]|nr:ABC transporter permease [Anaerolineaceae bacterium]